MKSVMGYDFSKAPSVEIPRSVFDRSFGYKTTFNIGELIPFMCDEVLPGDTFKLNASFFARLSTPIFPIMDNMFFETFYFFVPCRLVWDHWKAFMGEKTGPSDVTTYSIPYINLVSATGHDLEGTNYDYLGLPTALASGNIHINALPFRSLNLIYNEWFKDENLIDNLLFGASTNRDDGPDLQATYSALLKRGKRHDYFTSALPWPQKGTAVQIPLGSTANVIGNGKALTLFDGLQSAYLSQDATAGPIQITRHSPQPSIGDSSVGDSRLTSSQRYLGVPVNTGISGLVADLSNATASTVNALRLAFQSQKMLEKDARSGTRYKEIIMGHFGVNHPDLNWRPELLSTSSTRINVTPVQQTAPTGTQGTNVTPMGTLAGFGTMSEQGSGFTKSFTEHGYIIGIFNVRADLTYQEGLDRMWSRSSRLDFYWPSLAHLGEQTVLKKEIYCDGGAVDEEVFGYQERYAEYRYKPSKITGLFRSKATGTLHSWHLSQSFSSHPVLNQSFIEDNTPLDRCLAVQYGGTGPGTHFILDAYVNMKCTRPMPIYSIPGLIDHF